MDMIARVHTEIGIHEDAKLRTSYQEAGQEPPYLRNLRRQLEDSRQIEGVVVEVEDTRVDQERKHESGDGEHPDREYQHHDNLSSRNQRLTG
jgi:ketosteroid isomerase-like protein